jgi:hypothetical protein
MHTHLCISAFRTVFVLAYSIISAVIFALVNITKCVLRLVTDVIDIGVWEGCVQLFRPLPRSSLRMTIGLCILHPFEIATHSALPHSSCQVVLSTI